MDHIEKNKLYYPECWNDDARMEVLMAPFRVKSVNPENYNSKMNFWQEMIAKYCEYKGSPSFNKRELQLAFQRKDQLPYGLDNVLNEMNTTGKTRLKAEYMYDPENGWKSWAVNSFVKKPLKWGVNKVWQRIENESGNEILHLQLTKKFCSDIHTVLQKYAGQVMHFDDVSNIIKKATNLNNEGIYICLHTLHCTKKIFLEYAMENDEKKIYLVKIPGKSDKNAEISEKDRALYSLHTTKKDLKNQLHKIECEMKTIDEQIRLLLNENKRHLAKTYLRKKHVLENNHEKRSMALNNVEILLDSFEEAQSNSTLLEAFKVGSKALRNVLNESGLKYNNVDDIIFEVKETVESNNEIREVIANAHIENTFDDNDLERELKEILNEEPTVNLTPTNNDIQVGITDSELISMLKNLEVETSTPSVDKTHVNHATKS